MRRVKFAAFIVLMMVGTTGSLPDRSLALPLSDPGLHILAMTGNPLQRARYVCHRWWQWHGARWVRSCWPAGNDPCWNAPGCDPPNWNRPTWRAWGWPRRYWLD